MFFQSNPSSNPFEEAGTLGSSLKLKDIFSGSLGIGSQLISAYGKNPSTQIGFNQGQGSVFTIQAQNPSGGYGYQSAFDDRARQQQLAMLAAQGRNGLGLDDGASSVLGFISRNPLLVGAGALGVYLLMKEPPRRR